MTIAFAGGGTGGHFYPIIAIAEALRDLAGERQLLAPRLYYIAPDSFDPEALLENSITFVACPAGKMRRYASWQNFTDLFVTGYGYVRAVVILFKLFPDVIISKGGFASVPVTLAARTLGIPVIIHESDAEPGRANLLAARFAERIAVSFDDTAKFFPTKVRSKVARTGIPLRKEIAALVPEGARQYLGLDQTVPTVLILGGSSGSMRINETVLSALPDLVANANIIHQAGKPHITEVERTARLVLEGVAHAERYHPIAYLSALALREAASAADLVVSRAGATAIAEISLWKKPSVLIPIPESVSHDQRTNAYAYARTGAAVVLEEANLTPHVLVSEVHRITSDRGLSQTMGQAGAEFSDTDAARLIGEAALDIALSHEDSVAPASAPAAVSTQTPAA